VKTGNSPIAFDERISSRSPSPASGEFARKGAEEILSACIIVGEPNPLVGGVHDRMPVMLLPQDYDAWLGLNKRPEELRALLRPYDADLMEAYAVSHIVNSVKNDTEECIEPINDEITKAPALK
jgi:putative SOS response-associated peptidase YedK